MERSDDRGRSAFALHRGVRYDDSGNRASPPNDGDDVVQRRAIRTRDNSYALRQQRQPPFAFQGE